MEEMTDTHSPEMSRGNVRPGRTPLHRFLLPVRSDAPILVPTREAQIVEARGLVTFAHEEHADQLVIRRVDQSPFTVVKRLSNTRSIATPFLSCQRFTWILIVHYCLLLSLVVSGCFLVSREK